MPNTLLQDVLEKLRSVRKETIVIALDQWNALFDDEHEKIACLSNLRNLANGFHLCAVSSSFSSFSPSCLPDADFGTYRQPLDPFSEEEWIAVIKFALSRNLLLPNINHDRLIYFPGHGLEEDGSWLLREDQCFGGQNLVEAVTAVERSFGGDIELFVNSCFGLKFTDNAGLKREKFLAFLSTKHAVTLNKSFRNGQRRSSTRPTKISPIWSWSLCPSFGQVLTSNVEARLFTYTHLLSAHLMREASCLIIIS